LAGTVEPSELTVASPARNALELDWAAEGELEAVA
jgi:hypothetical protein